MAICLLALVVHFPLIYGEFTNYDDGAQITQFDGVKNANWDTVHELLTTNYQNKNANPMFLSFVANWALTPGSYLGFVVFNLAFFLIVVLVFFRFAALFIRTPKWRLWATALFAVHSVKAEVIGWISARCHLIGMPFFLGTFVAWDLYLHSNGGRKRLFWYIVALLCASFAILNKTTFVAVLPILVLFDFYKRRKIGGLFFFGQATHRFCRVKNCLDCWKGNLQNRCYIKKRRVYPFWGKAIRDIAQSHQSSLSIHDGVIHPGTDLYRSRDCATAYWFFFRNFYCGGH